MVLLAALPALGCLADFPNPLGPVSDAFIEPRILGRWSCLAADGSEPGRLTVMDFDGKQYYVSFVVQGEEPAQLRAYATRINETVFWNLRALGPKGDTTWSFVQYSFAEEGHLLLQVVRPDAFEGLGDDASAVRRYLEDNLENGELLEPAWDCTAEEEPRS